MTDTDAAASEFLGLYLSIRESSGLEAAQEGFLAALSLILSSEIIEIEEHTVH
jgi:hypothetical protein